MALTKTALVLVLVAASALGWENLPSIPANRRAEYFLQHDDGAYKFGYDTGEGQSAQATADAANQVQGEYSYVDKAGQRVNWQYTAGDGGFVPVMRGAPSGGPASGAGVAKVAGFGSRAHSAYDVPAPPAHSGAPSDDADYDENADASYNFNIDTDSYKRTESSDAKGNIKGQYSYNSPVGGSHAVSYIAGEGTGFVVTSDASRQEQHSSRGPSAPGGGGYHYEAPPPPLPSYGPSADGQTQINPDGSFAFSYSTADHDHQAVADADNNVRGSYSFVSQDDGQRRKIDYHAGAATGYVASGSHLPVAPAIPSASGSSVASSHHSSGGQSYSSSSGGQAASNGQTNINPDGSFSYSYSTGDQSKQESADAQNNVRGSFSYTSKDDGKTRKVDYIAGADTGFVATGDHLPVAPSPVAAGNPPVASSHSSSGAPSSYAGHAASSSSNAQSDGSYSFSYQTDDHSHHAASDAQGNVAGSFSFVADDGISRKIDYTAGADKGFVAKGAHLPVAPEAPAAPGGYQAPSSAGSGYQYNAPSSSGSSSDQRNSDGSYSYSYDAGSSSKQESADAQGNVAGSFSFLGGDGVNRQLTYTARGDEGFIAKGDHLPVAPAPAPGQEVGLSVQNAFAHPGLFAGSDNTNTDSSSGHVMASKDGAYSYSYSTGGQGGAAPSHSPSAGHNGFGAGARQSSGSSGHVMASKDGAYSYSYSTGGQGGAASSSSSGQNNVNAHSSSSSAASSSGAQANDGSYSFSYDAGTHSHEQSSDPHNNVRGSFSFKAKDDGQIRKVEYTAGAATGFVAKGAHLPVAPAASGSAAASYNGGNTVSQSANSGASSSGDENGDGSYSYSYKTDTSSKEESADAKGNVVGTFSFVGGDGINRKLTYTSKNEEGFVAAGDHLPVAPSVDGASQLGAKAASAQSHRFNQQASSHASGHSSSSHSSSSHSSSSSHAHALETRDGNIVISKYLPPDSVHKFGYIFDTKA